MIFPSAADMWTTVADGANEQNAFFSAVMEQLGDALVAKTTSTTVAIATYEGEEVNVAIQALRQRGFTVTNDGTNLTIAWGPV
jgi:dissimilatory sulfite reductase (desulfoviridin) alpha/beta subunit